MSEDTTDAPNIAAMAIAKMPPLVPGVPVNGGPLLQALQKIVHLLPPQPCDHQTRAANTLDWASEHELSEVAGFMAHSLQHIRDTSCAAPAAGLAHADVEAWLLDDDNNGLDMVDTEDELIACFRKRFGEAKPTKPEETA